MTGETEGMREAVQAIGPAPGPWRQPLADRCPYESKHGHGRCGCDRGHELPHILYPGGVNHNEANHVDNPMGLIDAPYTDSALSAVPYTYSTPDADIAADLDQWAAYGVTDGQWPEPAAVLYISPMARTMLTGRGLLGPLLSKHSLRVESVKGYNDAGWATRKPSKVHALAFTPDGPIDGRWALVLYVDTNDDVKRALGAV